MEDRTRKLPKFWELDVRGHAFIMLLEGWRNTAYKDSAGIWTIGVGHTAMAGPPKPHRGMRISDSQVYEVFRRDVQATVDVVRSAVKVPVTYCQFVALVSFAFNVGPGNFRRSTVLKRVNAGQFHLVPAALNMWVKVTVTRNGKRVRKTVRGLVNRRRKEGRLFSDCKWPAGIKKIIRRIGGSPVDTAKAVAEGQNHQKTADIIEEVNMNKERIMGAIRHVIGGLGAAIVALGYVDESTAQQIIGAAMAVIGFLWSWFAPEKSKAAE